MILIKGRQKKIALSKKMLRDAAQKMLAELGYEHFDLGIFLTTNRTIRKFNRIYRNKNKPTDILSFPYHPNLKPGARIPVAHEEDKNLGDLIISLEYVKKDAPRWQQSFESRLIVLLAHGIAHLLGYDHQTDEEHDAMQRIEKRLLRKFSDSLL